MNSNPEKKQELIESQRRKELMAMPVAKEAFKEHEEKYFRILEQKQQQFKER